MTIQIIAPHFTAGIWTMRGRVTRAAPIVRYMIGWTDAQVYDYADKKHWQVMGAAEWRQVKYHNSGQCIKCGKPAVTKTLCLRHAVKQRAAFKDRKGFYKPYRCKSRMAEDLI